jgi:hypothetical protein
MKNLRACTKNCQWLAVMESCVQVGSGWVLGRRVALFRAEELISELSVRRGGEGARTQRRPCLPTDAVLRDLQLICISRFVINWLSCDVKFT